MKALNKETAPKAQRPERIIQFGEGNFLRAFVDWIIYNMNQKTDFNSNVVVVQPGEGSCQGTETDEAERGRNALGPGAGAARRGDVRVQGRTHQHPGSY